MRRSLFSVFASYFLLLSGCSLVVDFPDERNPSRRDEDPAGDPDGSVRDAGRDAADSSTPVRDASRDARPDPIPP